MKIQTAHDPAVKTLPINEKTSTALRFTSSLQKNPGLQKELIQTVLPAKLPAEKLSASIESFARFFSLPVKPEALAAIRRQAVMAQQPAAASLQATAASQQNSPQQLPQMTASDPQTAARAFAAAAAESKGIELNPKALETLAMAINPDGRQKDSRQQERRENDQREKHDSSFIEKPSPASVESLLQIALQSIEKYPLLEILNGLPGKNGQRWMVYPFEFSENGNEFRVSLRILLNAEQLLNRSDVMALDIIKKNPEGVTEQRWQFVLETVTGKENESRMSICAQPDLPPKEAAFYVKELSQLLGIPGDKIKVKTKIDIFPLEADCHPLCAIDEEA